MVNVKFEDYSSLLESLDQNIDQANRREDPFAKQMQGAKPRLSTMSYSSAGSYTPDSSPDMLFNQEQYNENQFNENMFNNDLYSTLSELPELSNMSSSMSGTSENNSPHSTELNDLGMLNGINFGSSADTNNTVGSSVNTTIGDQVLLPVVDMERNDAIAASAAHQSIRDSKVAKPRKKMKSSHNLIEKKYRTNINSKILELRNCVPTLRIVISRNGGGNSGDEFSKDYEGLGYSDDESKLDGLQPARKLNKATILAKSVEYIKHLEYRNSLLNTENEKLKEIIQNSGAATESGSGNMMNKLIIGSLACLAGGSTLNDMSNDSRSLMTMPIFIFNSNETTLALKPLLGIVKGFLAIYVLYLVIAPLFHSSVVSIEKDEKAIANETNDSPDWPQGKQGGFLSLLLNIATSGFSVALNRDPYAPMMQAFYFKQLSLYGNGSSLASYIAASYWKCARQSRNQIPSTDSKSQYLLEHFDYAQVFEIKSMNTLLAKYPNLKLNRTHFVEQVSKLLCDSLLENCIHKMIELEALKLQKKEQLAADDTEQEEQTERTISEFQEQRDQYLKHASQLSFTNEQSLKCKLIKCMIDTSLENLQECGRLIQTFTTNKLSKDLIACFTCCIICALSEGSPSIEQVNLFIDRLNLPNYTNVYVKNTKVSLLLYVSLLTMVNSLPDSTYSQRFVQVDSDSDEEEALDSDSVGSGSYDNHLVRDKLTNILSNLRIITGTPKSKNDLAIIESTTLKSILIDGLVSRINLLDHA
ncbi:BA75_03852T0 [Komagataella pastoris]|uniref:BA75_03852T0 n=1 Tax=Komagataella pastoris TaxID=4922 RepID=A0A1B2JDZ0_PICPA|nr:BA75_03852T0 [Komagataella pastoris]